MLWKLESDDGYFRIYDSKKLIAGYFDPDYGDIFSKNNAEEIISSMLQNHDCVPGGMIMIPLVKFRLFDTDLNTTLANVEDQVSRVHEHLQKWKSFLSQINNKWHSVRISHTDQDMLTVSFQITFSKPTPLDQKSLGSELFETFEMLQKSGLL